MTFLAVMNLLETYGPSAVLLAQKLSAAIAAGKGNEQVTPADWDELTRLCLLSAEDIYKVQGVTPPPAKP